VINQSLRYWTENVLGYPAANLGHNLRFVGPAVRDRVPAQVAVQVGERLELPGSVIEPHLVIGN
jgi:hypothetical protein